MYNSCIFMRFSTIFTALFCPYIAHERTTHNLDYVSSLVALFLTEHHRSQNEGSLKSEERFQRAMRPALPFSITFAKELLLISPRIFTEIGRRLFRNRASSNGCMYGYRFDRCCRDAGQAPSKKVGPTCCR